MPYRPELFSGLIFTTAKAVFHSKLQGTNENVSDTFKIDNFIYCKILSKFFVDVIFLHCCVGMWQVNFKTETYFSQSHTVFSGCFKYAAPFLRVATGRYSLVFEWW